ncbi:MAG: HlyD family efflux transporter periplasmic adaptor subunit [Blastocatellia bacterium]|nr:HlyD family efflux transporter periplasmic adaptor subunit [Blastocatellia bacterium]
MKLPRKRIRLILSLLIAMVIVSGAIYAGYRSLPKDDSDLQPLTMAVESKPFEINIQAGGELQSSESVTISVPIVPVRRLHIAWVIPDGQRVNKGDVLVEFDPTEIDLKVLEHRSDLERARQRLSKGEMASDVDKADVVKDKKIAELELQKISEFLPTDEQIYARREIIEGQLDKEYTEKKIVFADARLELKGKVYSLEEAILLLERSQADTKINQAEQALASLKLLSPASGIVVYNTQGFFFGGSNLMPGRVVYVGMPLFNLVNPEKMEAQCYVLEKDAGELRADQSVTVTLDPFPGVEFTGKVKRIDKLARPIDRDSPVKYFQTTVALDTTDKELMKPGVKLKARIKAGQMDSVIAVPRSALVKKESGFIAFVQNGPGRFEPVAVSLGQGNLAQVVVTEGLKPGQVIALNPPDIKRRDASETEDEKSG